MHLTAYDIMPYHTLYLMSMQLPIAVSQVVPILVSAIILYH